MPYQPVLDTLQLDIHFVQEGETAQNSLYFYDLTAGRETADFEILADMVHESWDTTLKPFVASVITLNRIVVTDLTTDTSPSGTFVYGTAGTGTSPIMPTGDTFTTTFAAMGRGRSYRGRNYYVGMTEAQVVGNFVSASLRTALLGFYNFILAQAPIVASVPFSWVIVQREEDHVRLDEGVVHPITSVYHADAFIDYQRRRGAGRGR